MAALKKITQRSLQALETKNKLDSIALTLFTKHGFDKVTVDEITHYAGVSKGTFYNYFSAKDEVLLEQFNKIDNHYEQVLRRLKNGESAGGRMLAFVDAMCEYCNDIWGLSLMKVVYANQISLGKRSEMLLKKDRLFYKILADIIEQGRRDGEFTTELSAEEQVYLFARNARSILYEWCLHDGSLDLKETGRKVFQLTLRIISARD
ncbi:MAG: TetR/AcrR family transcriptional regulator [Deltaproteobacteria bacterium]|jgi:AcrR family transcriptional regulator|nr:TetR/AcrR family transcriptional regulator [Deltaproteobacteria bacterium]